MAPPVSFTKATLSYPIFAADFDPYNRGYLLVGGGGGESKSGVPNKITLLDCSSRATLSVAAEIDLSRDEDSVTSLAALASKDGLIALAGINSSTTERKAGRNQHLKSFEVTYPKERKTVEKEKDGGADADGAITKLGRSELFKRDSRTTPETYQRLLRLSPAQKRERGSKRIGAIATGLAAQSESEVVVFDATVSTPESSDIITRISLEGKLEAADLDIASPEAGSFSLAYVTDYDVYEQSIEYDFNTKKSEIIPKNPRRVHSIPFPDVFETAKDRSTYRSLRFLTPQNILLLENKPRRKGAELHILHLYPTGPAMTLLRKTLPSRIDQAIGLDVCILDADNTENRQVAVAVAGRDRSVDVFTLEYTRSTDTFGGFKHFTTLRDVHPQGITKICFSPFHSPTRPPPPETAADGQSISTPQSTQHPPPQYIRLASVSLGNTVVVDTFALSPLHPETRNSRYVLSHPRDAKRQRNIYIAFISFVVLVFAISLQSYFAANDGTAPTGIRSFLPPGAREILGRPAHVAQSVGAEASAKAQAGAQKVEQAVSDSVPSPRRLRELLRLHPADPANGKAVVLRESPDGSTALSFDVHSDLEAYLKSDARARRWHELDEREREMWRRRLVEAGEWAVEEGEAILKGIVFGTYAGFVAQAVS
ncbi:hypothetical protein LTR66_000001 [Elasticomyces elasticus]|nr:hypothetical protein LTR66_000001 [Elasticomyces elasticus]